MTFVSAGYCHRTNRLATQSALGEVHEAPSHVATRSSRGTGRGRSSRTLGVLVVSIGVLLLTGGGLEVPAAEGAARSCGTVAGSGEWKEQEVTVDVTRGGVRCGLARTVARRLFSKRAKFHPCGESACDYWTVRVRGKRWKGGFQMGSWQMERGKRTVGGILRARSAGEPAAETPRKGAYRRCRGRVVIPISGAPNGVGGDRLGGDADLGTRIRAKNMSCRKAKRVIKAPARDLGYRCRSRKRGGLPRITCTKGHRGVRFTYHQY